MKKFFLFSIAVAAIFTSCAPTAQVQTPTTPTAQVQTPTTPTIIPVTRLVSKSRSLNVKETDPVAVMNLVAELEVSPNKITYLYVPSTSVNMAGHDNVFETAVREALIANDNADVLVNMGKQTKYDAKGMIESITVSGYPAKYVNFRSINAQYVLELAKIYEELDLKIREKIGPNEYTPNLIPNVVPASAPETAPVPGNTGSISPLQMLNKLKK